MKIFVNSGILDKKCLQKLSLDESVDIECRTVATQSPASGRGEDEEKEAR